jgi:hypothetical protein
VAEQDGDGVVARRDLGGLDATSCLWFLRAGRCDRRTDEEVAAREEQGQLALLLQGGPGRCHIVKTGRSARWRGRAWNLWLGVFFRLVDAL